MSESGGILKKEEKNMRTLKKSLCLVLALIFVLGLCTIGANAIYSDDAAITYDEATTVLTGLGVIEGYPDGSFKPTNNVTRAEAAAMIARMMLGREEADKLPVGDVTFTDCVGTWGEAYIAFCANKGIIVGMGDGTFRPNDNVTGTQLAAMLLRALGYGVIGEYEGKGWDINAVSDALLYKIFADSKVTDFSVAATREETALYIFNTLWVQLVGYDVDRNYYDGLFRLANGVYVPVFFANEVFDLAKLQYVQIMENKYTGNDYTVVRDADGEYYKLNVETPLDLIAHEATAYVKATPVEDKVNHVKYYDTYLVKDESVPFNKGATYDDFYRGLIAANKANKNGSFSEFKMWRNYQEQWTTEEITVTAETAAKLILANGGLAGTVVIDGKEVEVDLTLTDLTIETDPKAKDTVTKHKVAYPTPHGAVTDWDIYFNKDMTLDQIIYYIVSGDFIYTEFAQMKGQASGWDSTYFMPDFNHMNGTYILDHAGKPLACRVEDYSVGQVKTVDDLHGEVEVKVWNGKNFDTDVYDKEFKDLALTYEGIAKKDYVVVQPVGDLTYIQPTSTVDIEVTRRSSTSYLTFNNIYSKNAAYGIPVDESYPAEEVNVGDKIQLLLAKDYGAYGGSYFAVKMLEKAGLKGVVYLNYADIVMEHKDWGLEPVYKAQCINEQGEEVIYEMTKKAFEEIATINDDGTVSDVKVGAYYAYVKANGKATLSDDGLHTEKYEVEFTKTVGKNSFLKRDGGVYYVTSDTNCIFFDGVAADLEIEVANRLADNEDKTPYDVYATYIKSGAGYKLIAVWCPGIEAPEIFSDTFMFICDTPKNLALGDDDWSAPAAYVADAKKNEVPVYTVYIDGQETEVRLTASDKIYDDLFQVDGGIEYVRGGFYQYRIDEDGIYHIAPVEKCYVEALEPGAVKNGKLYATYADGIEVKTGFCDISGDTTFNTKRDVSVISIEALEDYLEEGYTVYLAYCYEKKNGDYIPVGTIYTLRVVDHPEKED